MDYKAAEQEQMWQFCRDHMIALEVFIKHRHSGQSMTCSASLVCAMLRDHHSHAALRPAGVTAHINQDLVLYTDADVLFYHEFNPCTLQIPEVMAIGPEMDRVASSWSKLNWNAGILVMNLKGFAAALPNMLQWANSRHWDFDAADQSLLNEYFPAVYGRPLDPLPEVYNWKGYWGCSPNIVGAFSSFFLPLLVLICTSFSVSVSVPVSVSVCLCLYLCLCMCLYLCSVCLCVPVCACICV